MQGGKTEIRLAHTQESPVQLRSLLRRARDLEIASGPHPESAGFDSLARYHAGVAQLKPVEALVSETSECGFESRLRHYEQTKGGDRWRRWFSRRRMSR